MVSRVCRGFHRFERQAPVLAYPRFDHNAGTFHLQTDASAVGLGAVLEQNGHPVAYASRSLTSPEKQYVVMHSKRMSRNSVCPQAIPTLSIGRPFQNLDRSCPTAVVIHTKDGGYAVSVGTGHTRI